MNPATLAGFAGLLSTALAIAQWVFVGRKQASQESVTILEQRAAGFRKDIDNYRTQIDDYRERLRQCERNCFDAVERAKSAERRVSQVEEDSTRWRDEATYWKQMALGGNA